MYSSLELVWPWKANGTNIYSAFQTLCSLHFLINKYFQLAFREMPFSESHRQRCITLCQTTSILLLHHPFWWWAVHQEQISLLPSAKDYETTWNLLLEAGGFLWTDLAWNCEPTKGNTQLGNTEGPGRSRHLNQQELSPYSLDDWPFSYTWKLTEHYVICWEKNTQQIRSVVR